jgi:hypothetical protein
MVLDVVGDLGQPHEADTEAPFAQGLARELAAPQPSPSPVVVGATSVVAALAAASRMEAGEGIGTHRGTLIRPQGTRNWSTLSALGEGDPTQGFSGGVACVHRENPYPI